MDAVISNINRSASKFLFPLTLEQTYSTIVEEALNLFGGINGSIILESNGELKRVYSSLPLVQKLTPRKNGYIYKAYQARKPFNIDAQDIPWLESEIKNLGVEAITFIPLSYHDRTIGVLTIQTKNKFVLSDQDLHMMDLFSSMASLAILKTHLYEETKKISAEKSKLLNSESTLEKIHNSGLKFMVPLNSDETYSIIVHEAMKLVKADYGVLFTETAKGLEPIYASDNFLYKRKIVSSSFKSLVSKNRKLYVLNKNEVNKINHELKETNIKSIVWIPLYYRNKTFGVLSILSNKENFFGEENTHILNLFSSLATLAIRKMQLYDETKKALDSRDLFMSMAAHELRTPLTTISGYIQLLNHKLGTQDNQISRWIKELASESDRLNLLVNELLEVNRIKKGQLRYEWRVCSMKEIVERAVSSFKFIHPNHKLTLNDTTLENDDIVVGDFDKLLQLIINLLDNAAKFSSVDQQIKINIKKQANFLILQVQDRGKGIDKKDLSKVFDGFYRGDSQSEEGMGLGLFLAKNITIQHHGSIGIKSQKGNGTTVQVKLPLVKV